MEHIELTPLLIALLGAVIAKLLTVLETLNRKGTTFSFGHLLTDKMNWIRLTLTVLSIIALLMVADDLGKFFGFDMNPDGGTNKLIYLILGAFNYQIIRSILKIFKKRMDNKE